MDKAQKDELLAKVIAGEAELPAAAKKRETGEGCWCNHWARPVLLERAAYLRKLARFSEGAATDALCEFAAHRVQLSVQLRSGPAMLYESFACLLVAVEGRATLATGGTLAEKKRVGRGELNGTAIEGGTSQELRPGDVAHVPAGTPHQLLLAGESGFTYLVVKINETAAA